VRLSSWKISFHQPTDVAKVDVSRRLARFFSLQPLTSSAVSTVSQVSASALVFGSLSSAHARTGLTLYSGSLA
jgi:hypothetical protein